MSLTPIYPEGAPIPILLGAAAVSGVPFMRGNMLCVPVTDGANGETIAVELTGCHRYTKVSGSAWTIGQPIYWDVVALAFTHTPNTAANPRVGTAVAAAASGDVIGLVRLGHF